MSARSRAVLVSLGIFVSFVSFVSAPVLAIRERRAAHSTKPSCG
jgi:hypothetical protein